MWYFSCDSRGRLCHVRDSEAPLEILIWTYRVPRKPLLLLISRWEGSRLRRYELPAKAFKSHAGFHSCAWNSNADVIGMDPGGNDAGSVRSMVTYSRISWVSIWILFGLRDNFYVWYLKVFFCTPTGAHIPLLSSFLLRRRALRSFYVSFLWIPSTEKELHTQNVNIHIYGLPCGLGFYYTGWLMECC